MGIKKQRVGGWARTEEVTFVDIMPRGEEDRHIPDEMCDCCPRLSRDDIGRLMIIHKSFDGRDGFELAGEQVRARRAA